MQGIESIDWGVYDLIFIDDTGTNGDFLQLTKYETVRIGSILLADYGLTLDDVIGYEVEDEFFRTLYFGLVIYGVKNKESDYEETISLVRQAIEQRDE
jgi:hypothetical protein